MREFFPENPISRRVRHFKNTVSSVFGFSIILALILSFFPGVKRFLVSFIPEKAESHTEAVLEGSVGLAALEIPEYAGDPSCTINGGRPLAFTDDDTNLYPYESYSDLDLLGRCGVATAVIDRSLMPEAERESIGMVKPSGWHTVKYPELIEDKFLYNRCHLIAFMLTGENANEKNLITGTRYMNVEGMLPYETEVASYIRRTWNKVWYQVTPDFRGTEAVCRGVLIEAQSIGTDDLSICAYCYNVQPGIEIDYATGDSRISDFSL